MLCGVVVVPLSLLQVVVVNCLREKKTSFNRSQYCAAHAAASAAAAAATVRSLHLALTM